MIAGLLMLIFGKKKFIPSYFCKSIYDIDYDKLYDEGCRIILTDLDNTLISYKEDMPHDKIFAWKKMLEDKGFTICIVSNSGSDRVKNFASAINLAYNPSSMKPLKKGFKKVKKRFNIQDKKSVLVIGDQILTDILGGNRMGFNTALIEAIDRSTERKCTRFNRYFERKVVKKINKKYKDGVLKDYVCWFILYWMWS